ncbi:aromatic amino acid DMT transporter YddG [Pseudomonas putida]|uniref:aromatic amino acid DMT transporter YddG n=1 Tax=Pseudomonas putida TaxID=303 RepID=UPI003F305B5C
MSSGKSGATVCGLVAIVMWSTAAGLIRSISEVFGPIGGAALIYSLGAMLLLVLLGKPRLRGASAFYLVSGGGLFVLYEVCMSLSLGYAKNHQQAIEIGVVNYFWPCLTMVLAVFMNGQRTTWLLAPGTFLAVFGILWVVSGNGLSLQGLTSSVASNPVAFGLALACSFAFAMYCNVTRLYGGKGNQIVLFFILTGAVLWVKYVLSDETLGQFTPGNCIELTVAVLAVAGGYALWNTGITKGNLTLLATASYFAPVLSSAFAAFWLNTSLTIQFWQGALLVTVGSLICWHATRASSVRQAIPSLEQGKA